MLCVHAGSLHAVISKLGKHICLHVLTPLLKLHPHPVRFQTHLQRDEGEGSYTIEVSYSAAGSQQGEEEQCSVESAILQCLQVIKRRPMPPSSLHPTNMFCWPAVLGRPEFTMRTCLGLTCVQHPDRLDMHGVAGCRHNS